MKKNLKFVLIIFLLVFIVLVLIIVLFKNLSNYNLKLINTNVDDIELVLNKTYTNNNYLGFSFKYNDSWEIINEQYELQNNVYTENIKLNKDNYSLEINIKPAILIGWDGIPYCFEANSIENNPIGTKFLMLSMKNGIEYSSINNTLTSISDIESPYYLIVTTISTNQKFCIRDYKNSVIDIKTIYNDLEDQTFGLALLDIRLSINGAEDTVLAKEVEEIIRSITYEEYENDNNYENTSTYENNSLGIKFKYPNTWLITVKEFDEISNKDFKSKYFSNYGCDNHCMGIRLSKENVNLEMIFNKAMDNNGKLCSKNVELKQINPTWVRVKDTNGYFYSMNYQLDLTTEEEWVNIGTNSSEWNLLNNTNYKVCIGGFGEFIKDADSENIYGILMENPIIIGNPSSSLLREIDEIITSIKLGK